jgi:hypothetical protein
VITSQREQYGVTVHLFIGTRRNLSKITFMSLTFTISKKVSYRGLNNLFPFRSVSFSTIVPSRSFFILLPNRAFHTMYTFISKSKLPVTVYYTGKHVSRVVEDIRKMKAPNIYCDSRRHGYDEKSGLFWGSRG